MLMFPRDSKIAFCTTGTICTNCIVGALIRYLCAVSGYDFSLLTRAHIDNARNFRSVEKRMQELRITEEVEEVPLDVMFAAYCRMDPLSNSTGVKLLPLSQSDKWLASAKILDMHKVTTTDTGLCFFKFHKRAISFEEYLIYLEDLAQTKGLNIEDMKFAMQRCGKPVHPLDIKKKKK